MQLDTANHSPVGRCLLILASIISLAMCGLSSFGWYKCCRGAGGYKYVHGNWALGFAWGDHELLVDAYHHIAGDFPKNGFSPHCTRLNYANGIVPYFWTPPPIDFDLQYSRESGLGEWDDWFTDPRATPASETDRTEIVMPGWGAVILFALLPLRVLLSMAAKAWRKSSSKGRCANCGYDLRASPERCPECGKWSAAARSTDPAFSPGISSAPPPSCS
ncbi:MAG TPA: hypothetical protein VFE47_05095 [Tepidisphaeraceae bacterium]|jgi:hypothetical protein|nr:hypothetical protein [Tepidisphaeraceae bacterium]